MRKIKYEEEEKGSGGTETHVAADVLIRKRNAGALQDAGDMQNALEEGFAASDGVRGVTAASGGRVKHPENDDASLQDSVPQSIKDENSGLADN